MTTNEVRRRVRDAYPHITITVRTVSFEDLARASKKCLRVVGDRTHEELAQVNAWASDAGILPDTSLRFRAPSATATANDGHESEAL